MKNKLLTAALLCGAVLVSVSGCGEGEPAPARNTAPRSTTASGTGHITSAPPKLQTTSSGDSSKSDSSRADNGKDSKEVPETVKSIAANSGWIDAFEMFNGYMDKHGFEQNELWFQDVTGDNEPELIVGGYGINIYQPEIHIFEVYSPNGTIAAGEDLYTMWTARSSYGHDAFTLQAYRDTDGSLVFADGTLYEYTSVYPANGSGQYQLTEYSFGSRVSAKQILGFGYYNEGGKDSFSDFTVNSQNSDQTQLVNTYNGYFSGKTPLKAKIRTVKFSDYKAMSEEQRIKALTDSYYAFSYSESDTDAPLKSMIGRMGGSQSSAGLPKAEEKPSASGDIYTAYSQKLKELAGKNSAGCYYFYDLDSDGNHELIYREDENAFPYEAQVYEYKNGSIVYDGEIPAVLGARASLCYSSGYASLVISGVGTGSPPEYPSGAVVYISRVTKSGTDISTELLVQEDSGSAGDHGLTDLIWLKVTDNDVSYLQSII